VHGCSDEWGVGGFLVSGLGSRVRDYDLGRLTISGGGSNAEGFSLNQSLNRDLIDRTIRP
jgi:hypothetical protein